MCVLYIRTCAHIHVQTHSYTHITAALDTFPSLPSKRLLLNLGEKHVNMITQRPVRRTQSCREARRRRTDMAVGTKSTALLPGPEAWVLCGTRCHPTQAQSWKRASFVQRISLGVGSGGGGQFPPWETSVTPVGVITIHVRRPPCVSHLMLPESRGTCSAACSARPLGWLTGTSNVTSPKPSSSLPSHTRPSPRLLPQKFPPFPLLFKPSIEVIHHALLFFLFRNPVH